MFLFNPLYISLILLFFCSLWFLTAVKGYDYLKLALILIVPIFAVSVITSLNSYKGWPANEGLPGKSLFVSASIDQPHGSHKGAIYIWIIPPKGKGLYDYKAPDFEPRAYKLPYSDDLYAAVIRAMQLRREGAPVVFQKIKSHNKHHGHIIRQGQTRPSYRSYTIDTQLPIKY